MLTRRGTLGVLTGLIAAPLVVKADILMQLRGIKVPLDMEVPVWCPSGWVPATGQTVSKFQFPELHAWYKKVRQFGAHDSAVFRLPEVGAFGWPDGFGPFPNGTAERLQKVNGSFFDGAAERLQKVQRSSLEPLMVTLVSTQEMQRSNGRVCPPGMLIDYQVKTPEWKQIQLSMFPLMNNLTPQGSENP